MGYGDIGKLDNEDAVVEMREVQQYTLDYDTIFRCYSKALTISQRQNLDEEDFKDEFYEALLERNCPVEEADILVDEFNPA